MKLVESTNKYSLTKQNCPEMKSIFIDRNYMYMHTLLFNIMFLYKITYFRLVLSFVILLDVTVML